MRYFLYCALNRWIRMLPVGMVQKLLRAFAVQPQVAERAGFQVYPKVFYSPFPDPAEVNLTVLREKRALPGIPIDVPRALSLLDQLFQYAPELESFRRGLEGARAWEQTYPAFDTATLYTMLRQFKPRRYLEVGCGWSSRASSAALKRNRTEGAACEALYVEPYPPAHLKEITLPGEFLQKKVQDVPLETFKRLSNGDVLFIDTSHVIKTQNDVEYELLHILPILAPGVIVHIHDIFTPYDYPEEWLVGSGPNRGGPNEQYALECLLSGGPQWDIILPVHLLWREHSDRLGRLLPGVAGRPAAFWLRKRPLSL
jgi:hypothetical protein